MFDGCQVGINVCSKANRLFAKCDFEEYEKYSKEYETLSVNEKGKYEGIHDYIRKTKGRDISSLNLEYIKIQSEISKQIATPPDLKFLPIEAVMQEQTIIDLLSSFEDESYIKDIYKQKKLNVISGLNTQTAITLIDCIRQGRSLLSAGQKADILAKPLIDFYAASAYAYALIVINSPVHKSLSSLKGSHGHRYNHDNATVDFGGDIPRGTFLDLICALSVARVLNEGTILQYSLLDSIDKIQNNNISMHLNVLLGMVPEIRNYYLQYNKNIKYTHTIKIDYRVENTKNVLYNFYIGDGIEKPNYNSLQSAFNTENIQENHGSYKITLRQEEVQNITPTIYQDMYGDLWYIDSPIADVHLPEICLHFLIISALCNIMRYSPHEWNAILSNKISPSFSLLISRYLRLFEKKFPMLIVQYLSNFIPVIQ